jgi:hypothetical protein
MLTGKIYDAETLSKQLTAFIIRWRQLLAGGWSGNYYCTTGPLWKGMIKNYGKARSLFPVRSKV